VIALQYANRNRTIGVPLYIIGAVVVLSVVIGVAVLRAGGDPRDGGFAAGFLYGVFGYTIALGVQNVSSSFPFALALGATRRAFVLGNLLVSAAQGLLVAVAAVALLGLETATNGWFIGTRVLASPELGGGDALVVGGIMLLEILTALSVGGVAGAAFVRYGARGPLLLAVAVSTVAVLLLLLLVPHAAAIAAAFRPWWPAAGCAVVIGVGTVGQYLFLRRASIR
jgi:hypothetical protein